MIPVLLTKIKTRDGATLDGIAVLPKRKSRTALIWLHGLSSKFYAHQERIRQVATCLPKNGVGYFNFNTRGNHIAVKAQKQFLGSAFEKFKDCVLDIRAMINFAKRLGYRNIILAGHSTGANKALYYLYKTKDRSIKGLILMGPLSDVAIETKRIGVQKLNLALVIAEKLSQQNKFTMMPLRYGIWSPQRYLSLYKAGSSEDVFSYHNPKAKWNELKSIRQPVAVILGSRDEYLDHLSAKKLIEIFRGKAESTKSFSGFIIRGAGHSFSKKEKELTRTILQWIQRAIA